MGRCTPGGYVRASYSEEEIDLLAVYCGGNDHCYLLPRDLAVERKEVWLRLTPPLNGQRAGLNIASEFEFRGAIAQLGERSAGSRKVGGSSPPSSTPSQIEVGSNQFRNHFGYYLERAAAVDEILIRRHGRPHARLVPVQPPLAAAA
jgi:prevent-host-death family protein